MTRSKWIVLALIAVLGMGVAAGLSLGGPTPGLIDNADLRRLQSDGVRLLDVRTEAEYAGGHIPEAENIPMSVLPSAAQGWDPEEPIALYCATGNRSASAAETLRSLGFDTVYDLGGGITAWDGELAGGAAEVAATNTPTPSGLPIMYEFYTDW